MLKQKPAELGIKEMQHTKLMRCSFQLKKKNCSVLSCTQLYFLTQQNENFKYSHVNVSTTYGIKIQKLWYFLSKNTKGMTVCTQIKKIIGPVNFAFEIQLKMNIG